MIVSCLGLEARIVLYRLIDLNMNWYELLLLLGHHTFIQIGMEKLTKSWIHSGFDNYLFHPKWQDT